MIGLALDRRWSPTSALAPETHLADIVVDRVLGDAADLGDVPAGAALDGESQELDVLGFAFGTAALAGRAREFGWCAWRGLPWDTGWLSCLTADAPLRRPMYKPDGAV